MKIHFHTDNYWFSGSETTLLVLVEALSSRPDVETTFTFRSWAPYEARLRAALPERIVAEAIDLPDRADIDQRLIGSRGAGIAKLIKAVTHALPVRRACIAISARRLEKRFRAEGPDVVHINNGGFPGAGSCLAAAIAARRVGIPAVVMVVNNQARTTDGLTRMVDTSLDRKVERGVARFVTGSSVTAQSLSQRLDLPRGRVTMIPNAVIEGKAQRSRAEIRSELAIDDATTLLLVLGRFEVRKGHRYFVDAISELVSSGLAVAAVLAGEGPEEEELRRYVAQRGLSDVIHFVGQQRNVWDWLDATDALVLPSVADEDFPIVILEAMAAGRPVVASRVAGTGEQVVDGETGVLVPPRDTAALAAAISSLIEDPATAERLGAAGRQRYEAEFANACAVERYLALYEELMIPSEAPV